MFERLALRCLRLLILPVIGFACVGLEQAGEGNEALKTFEGTLETGVVVIGGETTGIILKTEKSGQYELELGEDEELRDLAKKLNGKKVVVEGDYRPHQGVEVQERHIIEVKSLREAE